jgi:hypothetical protein
VSERALSFCFSLSLTPFFLSLSLSLSLTSSSLSLSHTLSLSFSLSNSQVFSKYSFSEHSQSPSHPPLPHPTKSTKSPVPAPLARTRPTMEPRGRRRWSSSLVMATTTSYAGVEVVRCSSGWCPYTVVSRWPPGGRSLRGRTHLRSSTRRHPCFRITDVGESKIEDVFDLVDSVHCYSAGGHLETVYGHQPLEQRTTSTPA